MKKITLTYGEQIIAVVPQSCSGMGWANWPVWVYIINKKDIVRIECIQPHERTREMSALFNAGEQMHLALMAAVPVINETNS